MVVVSDFDAIVIGAGIQGSYTAYHLSKNSKTLLIDQFALPHSRGSSHGQTRIIRKAYSKTCYTHMMTECYQLWKQLEAEANVELFRTGFKRYQETQETADAGMWSNQQSAGGTQQDLFRRFGGTIRDGEKVVEIHPGSLVAVTTTTGIYRAKSLVITAGPWTNKLLNLVGLQLPLKTLRIIVCYWKEKVPGTYGISKGFPCFLRMFSSAFQHHFYGLPSNEYPGLMKVCYHNGNDSDPDERDIAFRLPSQDVNLLSDFLSKEFPGLDPKPAVIEYCMYTNTPDLDFILDHHPDHRNIIIGAGFSGHGFKLAPVVGKVLSELCIGKKPSYDLSPFKIHRFSFKSLL
ncbi:peroxisomal sarcosine oxidase isoform X2 [Pristis pectinata]|uniref:peroxisomal sarcosine oxidase isoform X2 n=1 Tax=Pristis pectinata TaxID=685728 RepID=UPI00223E5835|nr:peroxisomal sarcosine oxidase isoform X2 [Pristis pectinata]